MKRETKMILILVGVAVLIGALVWWGYAAGGAPAGGAPTPTPMAAQGTSAPGDYYEQFRQSRQEAREQEAALLDELIEGEATDAQVRREAQQGKLALAQNIEHELAIEQLLLAKGYADAAVTVSAGGANVVVKSGELTAAQTAVVLEAVTRQTGLSAAQVFIVTSP